MRVLYHSGAAEPRVVALGTFDGVPLGHAALIRKAAERAGQLRMPLRVMTFDRHPLSVVCPEQAPRYLSTLPEKIRRMAELGVAELQVLPFTPDMAGWEPETFLAALRTWMKPAAVFVGWNYSFGRRGRGNPELLEADGQRWDYETEVLPPVRTASGKIISSTAIREALSAGRLTEAEEMLGTPYTLSGRVVEGKHLGHTLGFPTANVRVRGQKQLPAFGVYLCRMEDRDFSYPSLVNIGKQPTLPSGHVTVEVHALEGAPQEYGRMVRVTLQSFLRPEHRFPDTECLRQQLEADCREARKRFGMA